MTERQLRSLTRRAYEHGSAHMLKKFGAGPKGYFRNMSKGGQDSWIETIRFAIKEASKLK